MAEHSNDAVSDAVRFNTYIHFSIHTDERAKHRTRSLFDSHRLTRKTSNERTAVAAQSRRHTLQEGLRTVCVKEICEKISDEENEEKEENDGTGPET